MIEPIPNKITAIAKAKRVERMLYSNAVFDAAGQEEVVRRLRSLVLLEDALLNLSQFFSELFNQLEGRGLCEVLLAVVAQWNLDSGKEIYLYKK